jgi:alkylation response protein AidB-like acyl-CoA dehydrogenase
MDFDLPEEMERIRETVAHFVTAEIDPEIQHYETEGKFPRPIIEKMGAAGLFGAAFPLKLGGTEAGFLAVAVIAEKLSELAPEFGYAMNMQAMTCPFTILNWGNKEQVERFVPDLITGRAIGMFALSESGGGSDAAGAMRATAKRDGDLYHLNGSKMWITFADACDTGLLFAKTGADQDAISAFIVEPKRFTGFQVAPIAMSGLSNCLRSSAVFLVNFPVPVENRLGNAGDGFKIAMNALEYGRLTVSARLVGLSQACLDYATSYANSRVIRGQPIARFQMIQQLIADMAVEIDAARLMTYRTGWLMDQGRTATRASSRAKYLAGRVAKQASLAVAEIYAGYALADEYPIAKLTAYINMLNVGEGTPNVQRILIAEDALGLKDADRHPPRDPASREWP